MNTTPLGDEKDKVSLLEAQLPAHLLQLLSEALPLPSAQPPAQGLHLKGVLVLQRITQHCGMRFKFSRRVLWGWNEREISTLAN